LLAISALQVSFDQHHAGIASNLFTPINRLPNKKSYPHFFNRPGGFLGRFTNDDFLTLRKFNGRNDCP